MPGLRWVRLSGLLVLSLLIVVGCGGSKDKLVIVSGVVKYNGQPLPGGTISFLGINENKDKIARTEIKEDGSYSLGVQPIGDVKVTVDGPSKPSETSKGTKPPVTIPKSYGKAESSGLTYTVTTDYKQTKDFDLK